MTTALTTYGLTTAASNPTTAATLATTTGGTSATLDTKIGTATGWGEVFGLGTTNAWAGAGSIGSASGHGWLLDSSLLDGQQIVSGNWTPTIRIQIAGGGTPSLTADLNVRAFILSGGTYTQIGSTMVKAAQTLNATTTNFAFSAALLPLQSFQTGDRLYLDMWFNVTANTGTTSANNIRISVSSTTTGVTNLFSTITPGYQVTPVTNNTMVSEDDLVPSDTLLQHGGVSYTGALQAVNSQVMNVDPQVIQSVLSSLWAHGWKTDASVKQYNGQFLLSGGMFINWEQAITWSSYDLFMDVNEVATTSSLLGAGLTQVNAHDPQVCLHYLRAVALYKAVTHDTRYDYSNVSGFMGLSQMVDHVTLTDFVPSTVSNQSGPKGYNNPKGWVYFAMLDCYLYLKDSPLLNATQVRALKQAVLYQAWTYYNVWYDSSVPILCSTSHTPHTYQPSQSLYMAAALLDAAQRFPNDIQTGMFYSASAAPQSPSLWQGVANASITSILNRGAWSATYNIFSGNMTVQAGPTDFVNDAEGKVGDEAEAAVSLIYLYTLTGTTAYLTQAQTLLESIEAKCLDATNGGYFFAFYTDGTPLSNAYKESRANAHMLWAYTLYNQVSPIYITRQKAVLVTMLANFYKPFGEGGFWYRTDVTSSFAAYVDKYVNPFTDTLYAQANGGDTSVQVHTDVNLGTDKLSIILEPRTTNTEELNFIPPAIAQGTASTLAQDTFVRANQSGWGTASNGSVWNTLLGTATLSIVSNQGVLGTPNSATVVQLGSSTFTDCDLVVRWSVGSLAHRPGLVARITGTNPYTYYQVQLVNTGTGLKFSKIVNGVTTTLITGTPGGQDANSNPNFTIGTGTFYWFRLRVQGSILAAKCWIDGTTEQVAWDVQFVDTSIAGPGGVGIVGLCTVLPGDTYDSFSVTSIPIPYVLSIDPLSNGGTGKLSKTHASGTAIQSLTFPNNNVETQYTTEAMCGVLVYLLLYALSSPSPFGIGVSTPSNVFHSLDALSPTGESGTQTVSLVDLSGILSSVPTLIPGSYTGSAVYPINPPLFPYMMNGSVLQTQPYLFTAPSLSGLTIPAGSAFTLLFSHPSTATQSALASGVTGTMVFAAHNGQRMNGPVQITSSFDGATLVVSVTTLTDISLNTRVISTPFF